MSKHLSELREAAQLVIDTWRNDGAMNVKATDRQVAMNAAIRYMANTMGRGIAEEASSGNSPVEIPSGAEAVLSR